MLQRLFDFSISLAALPSLSPLFLLLALLGRVKIGSPIFFTQTRPGFHGNAFIVIKFLNMTNARGRANGVLLPYVERLICFGRFLRATSLDELPELWNVLKGDMSRLGPRPLLVKCLPLHSPQEARLHHVRRGITGWAQVNSRKSTQGQYCE